MVPREIRGPRRHDTAPSLRVTLDFLAPRFRSAVRAAALAYEEANVRYALVGGVAASAYSQPRATKDVDFLVGDEAFVGSAVISFRAGIPIEAHGVPIDSIPPHVEYRDLYERALDSAVESDEASVLIARPEMVAATKLVGGRPHDIDGVVQMIRAGALTILDLEIVVAPYYKLHRTCARVRAELERPE